MNGELFRFQYGIQLFFVEPGFQLRSPAIGVDCHGDSSSKTAKLPVQMAYNSFCRWFLPNFAYFCVFFACVLVLTKPRWRLLYAQENFISKQVIASGLGLGLPETVQNHTQALVFRRIFHADGPFLFELLPLCCYIYRLCATQNQGSVAQAELF